MNIEHNRNIKEKFIHYLFTEKEKAYEMLYTYCHRQVKEFILRDGGSIEDAQENFLNVILIIDERFQSGKLLATQVIPYFYNISIRKWIEIKRRKNLFTRRNESKLILEELDEPEYLNLDRFNLVMNAINKMDNRCKDLLHLWVEGYSLEEITERFQFASPSSTKKELSTCRKKLRDLCKEIGLGNI
jgi:DNA-directed RNA polymerase specialized sigma24 family protein